MNETAALQSSFDEMAALDPVDCMTGFGPVDPQLRLPHLDGMPELVGQIDMSAPACNNTVDFPSMSSFTELDFTAGANRDVGDDSLCPSSITSSTDPPTKASQIYPASSSSPTLSLEIVPKKPRKGSDSQETEKEVVITEDEAKRNDSLRRNRIAASKCRQKKKVWQHNLEEQKSDLETQHSLLQKEYNNLLNEASQMKNHLMAHASCNDRRIDQWVENEAMQFIDKVRQRKTSNASTAGGVEWRDG